MHVILYSLVIYNIDIKTTSTKEYTNVPVEPIYTTAGRLKKNTSEHLPLVYSVSCNMASFLSRHINGQKQNGFLYMLRFIV